MTTGVTVAETDLPPGSWTPSLPADVRFRRMRGQMLVARRDQGIELDDVGAAIFGRIDGDTTVLAIAGAISAAYDIDQHVAVTDVGEFLVQLIDLGILERDW
jgi:hypothetical protein